jgi:hypothetical protein
MNKAAPSGAAFFIFNSGIIAGTLSLLCRSRRWKIALSGCAPELAASFRASPTEFNGCDRHGVGLWYRSCFVIFRRKAATAGGVAEWSIMLSIVLKKLNTSPVLKYSLIAGAAALWIFGLSYQIPDFMQAAKYVGISGLMVAVAALA